MDAPVEVVFSTSPQKQTILGKVSPVAPLEIEEFRGIPYGTVPGRWRHSVLKDDLPTEPFDATKNGPQCPQPPQFANSQTYQAYLPWPTDVGESEYECLNLFILRPSSQALQKLGFEYKNEALPVYTIIHGGGFGFGAATDPMWDPTRLLLRGLEDRKPFIAVVINYRLGIFGFGYSSEIAALQTDPNELKGGNFGLGDQSTALRWISKHIAAFGGDPMRITIAGQSAGGVSVQVHALEAKYGSRPPLFHRAIQQSGGLGTLRPISLDEVEEMWQKIYANLGTKDTAKHTRLKALEDLSANNLLTMAAKIGWIIFAPVQDDLTITKAADREWRANFTKAADILASKDELRVLQARPIAILLGDCEEEGFMPNNISKIQSLEALTDLLTKLSPHLSPTDVNEILAVYNIGTNMTPSALHKSLVSFVTDCQFGYPVDASRAIFNSKSLESTGPTDGKPARLTEIHSFRFKNGNPFPGKNQGVAHHCIDLIYIYNCFHTALLEIDENEHGSGTQTPGIASNLSLVSEVQRLWIEFITSNKVKGTEEICTTFEVDRTVHRQNMQEDAEWVARRRRFAVLSKHQEVAKEMLQVIQTLG